MAKKALRRTTTFDFLDIFGIPGSRTEVFDLFYTDTIKPNGFPIFHGVCTIAQLSHSKLFLKGSVWCVGG